jgi:hypothetical protein
MSDFLAIVVSGDTVLNVVDFDRPVCFIPGQMKGLRVIPDPKYFITDALAVFRDGVLDECESSCKTNNDNLNDFSENHVCAHLEAARQKVRKNTENVVIVLHNSALDTHIANDLNEFAHPPVVQKLHNENGERLGLV